MNSFPSSLLRRLLLALAVIAYLSGSVCRAVQKDRAEDHLAMGDDQLSRCNPAGAIVEYDLAIRLKPKLKKVAGDWLAISHFMLAEKLARQDDYPVALSELEKALELRPKEAYWHLARALLEARMGDLTSARSDCGQAAQLEKNDAELAETCKDPGTRFTYNFIKGTVGPAADSFAELEALKSDATSPPVATHVPFYGREWPGSMVAMVATIRPDGKVSKMQIVKPMGMGLDQRALKIMQKSRFKPAMRMDVPVETRALIIILFGFPCSK